MSTSPQIISLLSTAASLLASARLKRYQINVFVAEHPEFPVNTYVSNSSKTVATCVEQLLDNPQAGLSRVEVRDATRTTPLLVMAPRDLDCPQGD